MQATEAVGPEAAPRPAPAPVLSRPGFQVWLGLFPILCISLAFLCMEIPLSGAALNVFRILGAILFFGGFLVCLAGLLVGWLNGFPTWSFPYIGLVVLMSFYLSGMPVPGWLITNPALRDAGLLSWRAFVPLAIVALLGLALGRPPWRPLVRLVRGVWQDWTRLVFGLYILLPFTVLIFMDEIDPVLRFWVSLPVLGLTAACAFLYLRHADRRLRFAWLLGGAFIAALASTAAATFYWQTYDVNFSTGSVREIQGQPVHLEAVLVPALITAAQITLLLIAPALIGVVRWIYHAITPPLLKP